MAFLTEESLCLHDVLRADFVPAFHRLPIPLGASDHVGRTDSFTPSGSPRSLSGDP